LFQEVKLSPIKRILIDGSGVAVRAGVYVGGTDVAVGGDVLVGEMGVAVAADVWEMGLDVLPPHPTNKINHAISGNNFVGFIFEVLL
jgi:hypothetical protein